MAQQWDCTGWDQLELTLYDEQPKAKTQKLKAIWPPLTVGQARRLHIDVEALARACFGRPPRAQPSQTAKELRKASRALAKGSRDLSNLSQDALIYAGYESAPVKIDTWSAEEIRALRADLKQGAGLAEGEAGSSSQTLGRSHPNEPLRTFVSYVAILFERCTGRAPTHGYSEACGHGDGEFDRFVRVCLKKHYPEKRLPERAVDRAVRNLSGKNRLVEFYPEKLPGITET